MSGATNPQEITFDPTPEAVKGLQKMTSYGLMERMQGRQQGMPQIPNLGSVFTQLYGVTPTPGSFGPGTGGPSNPGTGSPGTGTGSPMTPDPPNVDPGDLDPPRIPPTSETVPPGGPFTPDPPNIDPVNPNGPVLLPGNTGGITPELLMNLPPHLVEILKKLSPISSGSRSIRSGVGGQFPSLMDSLGRR